MNSWTTETWLRGCRWCGSANHLQMDCPKYLGWRVEYDAKFQRVREETIRQNQLAQLAHDSQNASPLLVFTEPLATPPQPHEIVNIEHEASSKVVAWILCLGTFAGIILFIVMKACGR